MKVAKIRAAFLDYFKAQGHTVVQSASLIPKSDPSLLFVNAGMVPFKSYFLGHDKPPFTRAASSQHCLRVGGKHNDLDNVGKTARHHTFFEMLGSFSFGDYSKQKAIEYAWTFLTEVVKLPVDKLWVTVFYDDHEARSIWTDVIGVDADRVISCGEADNFWSMGDTGPCGPCTEIFYDHGPEVAGGPPGSPDEDGDRYVEIWNVVFMEFNRSSDGQMTPLPKPCVDTGMGLERIAAVLQGVHSNYDIDVFKSLIDSYKNLSDQSVSQIGSQVVADHMRSICWLIHDGIRPSNEGRGYVLRRIIRRALRFAYVDQVPLPNLHHLVKTVVEHYKHDASFVASQPIMERTLLQEEEAFARTIDQGIKLFEKYISSLDGSVIPGELAFKLYDTYGFPLDLVVDLAEEKDLTVDVDGFDQCMAKQKHRSRQNQQFSDVQTLDWLPDEETEFLGYTQEQAHGRLLCIHAQGENQTELLSGEAMLVFDKTPFYSESGGQIGDVGVIKSEIGTFKVSDTQRHGSCTVHFGCLESGSFTVGESCELLVDENRRCIRRNHSATHLLHDALIAVLGDHVMQKGSLVTAERLRFDFSHSAPLTSDEVDQIEQHVNALIDQNFPVTTDLMKLDDAKSSGVKALFDEKYADDVRVLTMGPSRELCGGTHVARTGDIGLFMIVEQTAVAQGIRRVEAVTSQHALVNAQRQRRQLQGLAKLCQSPTDAVGDKVEKTMRLLKQQQKTIDGLNVERMRFLSQQYLDDVALVHGARILTLVLDIEDVKLMRVLTQCCLSSGQVDVVVCLLRQDQKIMLSVGVVDAMVNKVAAVDLFRNIAETFGAKGGGKRDFAQGSAVMAGAVNMKSVRDQCHLALQDFLQN